MNITINLNKNTFKNLFIRLKEYFFGKDEIITVVVEKENGVLSHYILPKKLNRIYRKRYGEQLPIKENIFLGFIIAKLPEKEGIEYFAHIRKEELQQLAAHSSSLTDNHFSSKQTFSIPYKKQVNGIMQLDILSELNGKSMSKNDVENFKSYWKDYNELPTKEDIEIWLNSYNNEGSEIKEK